MVNALADMVSSLKVGNPLDPETFVGPIITKAQHDRVKSYIQLGIEEGARIVAGGPGAPDGAGLSGGNYVRPTVFADAHNNMRIAREEIFGPVIVVIPYDGVEEAIKIANDSEYGLSGSIWTADRENGLRIARQIRTGTLSINASMGDFDSPFGGYKNSGIGREFGSAGIDQYVEQKSIVL